MPSTIYRRRIVGYALRPLVQCLAPASRLLTPSANKLITALDLSHCTQPRFILDFRSEDGQQNVHEWYKSQGRNTRFTLLEYRKQRYGQVKHEFIVVWLNNTTLCRFDRRARDGERGHILRDEGVSSEDSAHVLSSFETEYKELLVRSEVLLSIKLPHGEDLGVIVAICAGIQTHSKASAYNIMRYNCYFFSWMIVAAVARRTYNWTTGALTREGWGDILRTSVPRIFPASTPHKDEPAPPPERAGTRLWFTKAISKLLLRPHVQPRNVINPSLSTTNSDIETFQGVLLSEYYKSYNSVESALSKLLLRSQLGPTLVKELSCVETAGILSGKRVMAENKVLLKSFQYEDSLRRPFLRLTRDGYEFGQLREASHAAAEALSRKEGALGKFMDDTSKWKTAWTNAWEMYRSPVSESYLTDPYPDPMLVTYGIKGVSWSQLPDEIMIEWKSAWDECDRLAAHCASALTPAVMPGILERLTDVAPEQLVFGDESLHHGCTAQLEFQPALQEFIRSRMQEHFELVDSLGFGSFHELITTAEEAMCEIWVTSLDTIKSSRYQPSYTGPSQDTA